MIYVIALLASAAATLLVLAVGAAFAGADRGGAAARRLALLLEDELPPAAGSTAIRARIEARVMRIGERMLRRARRGDDLRRQLQRAGFRHESAAGVFLALRTAAVAALLLAAVFVSLSAEGVVALLFLPYAMLVGWYGPRFWLSRRIAQRQRALVRSLPDMVDLLVVCVEAGLGLNQAIVRVGREMAHGAPEMAAELEIVNLEIRAGTPRDEALRSLGERAGVDQLRALATMLIQADRFGTSVAQALRVHADSLRTERRQNAEEKAAKTTIKLVVPLVFLIFPALFVVILGPALIAIVRQLAGG